MIEAYLYQLSYLIVITILTFVYIGRNNITVQAEPPMPSLLLCVGMILFIGFRPHSYLFVDTMNYVLWWNAAGFNGFDSDAQNLLFDNLYGFMAGTGFTVTEFFLIIAAIYFGGMWVACRRLFPCNTMLAFLVCLAAFSTFTYGTNGIKAGAATSLFLVALAFRDRLPIAIIFILLSWGFHHSMQLPVAAFIIALIFRKEKWYFYGWVFCLLIAIAHITYFQQLFGSMSDEGGQEYLIQGMGNEWGGNNGFRYDFVLYSSVPVVLGYFIMKRKIEIDNIYRFLLKMYILCNGVWMLCMYASFTNRIAYLSWFMLPLVLIYPYFKLRERVCQLPFSRKIIVLGHLFFTLFMTFVYYG